MTLLIPAIWILIIIWAFVVGVLLGRGEDITKGHHHDDE